MPKYKVLVTEVYQRAVAVNAVNKEEAHQRVSDAWGNTEFLLEPEDCFIGVEFNVEGETDEDGLELIASMEECQ